MADHRLYIYRVTAKELSCSSSGKSYHEKFIKIGMTSQKLIHERFTKYPDNFVKCYNFNLMTSQRFPSRELLYKAEQELHQLLQHLRFYPSAKFSGYTECYIKTPESIKMIKKAIMAVRLKYTPTTPLIICCLKQQARQQSIKDARAKRKSRKQERFSK